MCKYFKFQFFIFLVVVVSLPFFVLSAKDNSQKEIIIVDSGIEFQIQTQSKNVSQILKDSKIQIDEKDLVFPSGETEINSGGKIIIKRAIPIKIIYYDKTIEIKTWAKTVKDVLNEKNIVLNQFDRINFKLDSEIISGMEIIIEKPSPKIIKKGSSSKQEKQTSALSGLATWYGPGFYGRKTACGEIFSGDGLTAAHRTLPCGSSVRVTNLNNGLSTIVRINDRGPYGGGVIIDLSPKSKEAIGMGSTAPVKLEVIN